jgi:hypothetical protein
MSKKLPTQILATSIPTEWVKVKSSTIQAVSYNKEAKAMHVMFLGGGVYELTPVPAHRHNAFMKAESKGKYYAEHFKSHLTIKARRIDNGVPSVANQRLAVKDYKSESELVEQKFDTKADKLNRSKDLVVATPLYLALLKTKKAMGNSTASLPYLLWCACGKEDTTNVSKGQTRYHRCLQLISEASGIKTIGAKYLDAAIALASERKV